MQAFMNAFDYSGFEVIPKPKRICNYSGSLVGHDIKAFAQMALFILEPYLSAGEKKVWIAMLKVHIHQPCQHASLYFPNQGF